MYIYWLTGALAIVGLLFAVASFGTRWTRMQRLPFPKDRTTQKDTPIRGIRYAFTVGMAPWAKESTRIHWVAYMRGIAFHVGVFAGLAALMFSPWFGLVDPFFKLLVAIVVGIGALLGAAGGIMRLVEHNLRMLSTPDDHLSVWLVTLFLASMTGALLNPEFVPLMWLCSAAMLVYAPLGKIRHCVYFYFGRLFYGLHIGRRGVVRGLEAGHGR